MAKKALQRNQHPVDEDVARHLVSRMHKYSGGSYLDLPKESPSCDRNIREESSGRVPREIRESYAEVAEKLAAMSQAGALIDFATSCPDELRQAIFFCFIPKDPSERLSLLTMLADDARIEVFKKRIFGESEPSEKAFRTWLTDNANKAFENQDKYLVASAVSHWCDYFGLKLKYQGQDCTLSAGKANEYTVRFRLREPTAKKAEISRSVPFPELHAAKN